MALHLAYRPQNLDEVFGNDSIKTSLKTVLARGDRPHAYLFVGGSGCGKTTFGRIIKDMLRCSGSDYYEFNTANSRGIDTVREISQNINYSPLEGPCKVFLLDECFAEGTQITTDKGNVPIESVKQGDTVKNLVGTGKVTHVFCNKVDLSRVARIQFSDGGTTYCSKEHEFLTVNGWKKAVDLYSKDLIFHKDSDIVRYTNALEVKDEYKIMRMVQNRICTKEGNAGNVQSTMFSTESKQQSSTSSKETRCHSLVYSMRKVLCEKAREIFLFSNLLYNTSKSTKGFRYFRDSKLRSLWRIFCREYHKSKTFLFPTLCWSASAEFTSHTRMVEIRRAQTENTGRAFSNRSRTEETSCPSFVNPNEAEESFTDAGYSRKTNCNSANKWYNRFQKERRKRNGTDSNRNVITRCFRKYVGEQFSCENSDQTFKRLSDTLQDRCSTSSIEDRDRSRRRFPQWERKEGTRSKEGISTERVRVENVEVYKQGYNDESFSSIIGDKERNQGFVSFYDLEVDSHHSYFANDVLVHNCHQFTGPAAQALLKVLEDTPPHVYFILCTTDPDKLIKTILTRCTTYQVQALKDKEMTALIDWVLECEEKKITAAVKKEIVRVAEGCARQALVILDQVIDIKDETEAIASVTSVGVGEAEVIDICRHIIAKGSWNDIREKVKLVLAKSEPEKLRYAVLGYFAAVLLGNKSHQRASEIIDIFSENTYSTGRAGVINMIYLACSS